MAELSPGGFCLHCLADRLAIGGLTIYFMSLTDNKLINYLLASKAEMKKVTWPTKKQTIDHTLLVIGISLAVAVFLGALDYVFSLGLEKLIQK